MNARADYDTIEDELVQRTGEKFWADPLDVDAVAADQRLMREIKAENDRALNGRRRFTETSTLCEVEFQLEIEVQPEIRNSYGYSPAEVELVSVKVWGVDIPLASIPQDVKDALMEGIS